MFSYIILKRTFPLMQFNCDKNGIIFESLPRRFDLLAGRSALMAAKRHSGTRYLEANMAPTRAASKPHAPREDPLAYLPCSHVAEYRKSQVIYNQNEPSTSIYLVLEGKVKVFRLTEEGHHVLVNICQTDEFFGESAFLHFPLRAGPRPEQAMALKNTKLMTWTASEEEEVVMRQPRLRVALLQMLALRT